MPRAPLACPGRGARKAPSCCQAHLGGELGKFVEASVGRHVVDDLQQVRHIADCMVQSPQAVAAPRAVPHRLIARQVGPLRPWSMQDGRYKPMLCRPCSHGDRLLPQLRTAHGIVRSHADVIAS